MGLAKARSQTSSFASCSVELRPQANATMIMADQISPRCTHIDRRLAFGTMPMRSTRSARPESTGLTFFRPTGRLADCTVLLADVELGRERRLRLALKSIEDTSISV